MNDFTYKVTALKSDLSTLTGYTTELKNKTRLKFTSINTPSTESKLNTEILSIEQLFMEKFNEIKQALITINEENNIMHENEYQIDKSFLYKTRISHYNMLANNLSNQIKAFHKIQFEYLQKEEDRAISQYIISNPGVSIEIAKEELKKEQFKKGSLKAQRSLSSAESRNRTVNEIMQSVQQIAMLIDEVDDLVNAQDNKIQKIEEISEVNVQTTEKAKKSLSGALETQKRITWLKRIGILVVGILVGLFIIWFIIKIVSAVWPSSSK